MSTYTRAIDTNFGASKAGRTGDVYYRVLGADNSTLIARTSSGVTELVADSGAYGANVANWDSSWVGRIIWDITGVAGVTVESFGGPVEATVDTEAIIEGVSDGVRGTGPIPVTVTVENENGDPLEGATVTVFEGSGTVSKGHGETDENGEIVVNIRNVTTRYVVEHPDYATKVESGPAADRTITMAARVLPVPSDPGYVTVWFFLREYGPVEHDVEGYVALRSQPDLEGVYETTSRHDWLFDYSEDNGDSVVQIRNQIPGASYAISAQGFFNQGSTYIVPEGGGPITINRAS